MGGVRRAWDLTEIGRAYERFVAEQRPQLASVTVRSTDEEAYATRFRLVHAWRTFLFQDPQLPPALLPERWPGTAAASFFDRHAARLRPAADRYVEQCLDAGTRIGRFLLQETGGKVYAPFARPDWLPGSVIASAIITASLR